MKHLSAVLETQCNLSPNDFNLIRVKELDSDFQHVLSTIRFQQQQQKIEDDWYDVEILNFNILKLIFKIFHRRCLVHILIPYNFKSC